MGGASTKTATTTTPTPAPVVSKVVRTACRTKATVGEKIGDLLGFGLSAKILVVLVMTRLVGLLFFFLVNINGGANRRRPAVAAYMAWTVCPSYGADHRNRMGHGT